MGGEGRSIIAFPKEIPSLRTYGYMRRRIWMQATESINEEMGSKAPKINEHLIYVVQCVERERFWVTLAG